MGKFLLNNSSGYTKYLFIFVWSTGLTSWKASSIYLLDNRVESVAIQLTISPSLTSKFDTLDPLRKVWFSFPSAPQN